MRLHSIVIASLLFASPMTALAQEATPTPAAPSGPAANPNGLQSPGSPPSLAIVPTPREEPGVSGYRVLAITAGTVVGLIVANYLTGGTITPILAAGTGTAMDPVAMAAAMAPAAAATPAAAAPAAAAPGLVATVAAPVVGSFIQVVVLVAGAGVGGAVGNWLYNK